MGKCNYIQPRSVEDMIRSVCLANPGTPWQGTARELSVYMGNDVSSQAVGCAIRKGIEGLRIDSVETKKGKPKTYKISLDVSNNVVSPGTGTMAGLSLLKSNCRTSMASWVQKGIEEVESLTRLRHMSLDVASDQMEIELRRNKKIPTETQEKIRKMIYAARQVTKQ